MAYCPTMPFSDRLCTEMCALYTDPVLRYRIPSTRLNAFFEDVIILCLQMYQTFHILSFFAKMWNLWLALCPVFCENHIDVEWVRMHGGSLVGPHSLFFRSHSRDDKCPLNAPVCHFPINRLITYHHLHHGAALQFMSLNCAGQHWIGVGSTILRKTWQHCAQILSHHQRLKRPQLAGR